jgi:hypothetical protein
MHSRLTALVSALALGVLASVAQAYISPSVIPVADALATEAAALHNYVHAQYPAAFSGATVHAYDTAADKLDEDLFAWSLGLKPESIIYPRMKTANQAWQTYLFTVKLEKLYAGDPVGRKMHNKCARLHMVVEALINGLQPVK